MARRVLVLMVLTDEAHRALVSVARPSWDDPAVRAPDGRWLCPVGAEDLGRLRRRVLEGETISDAVVRLVATGGGRRLN